MQIRTWFPKSLLLLAIPVLAACVGETSGSEPDRTLRTSRLEPVSIVTPSLPLKWPDFLLAEEADRFLWGERQEIFRIQSSEQAPVVAERAGVDFARGLDRLVAAARTQDGTLAVLDTSGQVAAYSPASGQAWKFKTSQPNRPGALAVAGGHVYLLLQAEFETGSAVVAYTLSGKEAGRWGEMPADAIIQANLKGGGIAACPDGSIFYSYINSPRIYRLDKDEEKSVHAVGRASGSFQVVSENQVFKARRESMKTDSVKPLVKLGLGASRVMSLTCSNEGLLYRQVAQPGGAGAHVEVWEPLSGSLLGIVPVGEGVLLDIRDRTLYLGTLKQDKTFALERVQVHVEPARPGEAAG